MWTAAQNGKEENLFTADLTEKIRRLTALHKVCLHCEKDIPSKHMAAAPRAAFIKCQEKADRREIEIDEIAELLVSAA